jgi:hypothetical protein
MMAALLNARELRAQEPPPDFSAAFERCSGIKDDAARLRCYENAAAASAPNAKWNSTGVGSWRLVRTPKPASGTDAVAIMQTADISRSDLDFAGLTLRCGITDIEMLVVLIRPFPFRAHPRVTVTADGKGGQFTTTVVPPGSVLLLPGEATSLAAGPWQSSRELVVEADDENPIRGVVPLTGLGPAYRTLVANCRSQASGLH